MTSRVISVGGGKRLPAKTFSRVNTKALAGSAGAAPKSDVSSTRGIDSSIQVLARNRNQVVGRPGDRNNAKAMARVTLSGASSPTRVAVYAGDLSKQCGSPNVLLVNQTLQPGQRLTVKRLANYPTGQKYVGSKGSLFLCAQPQGGGCTCANLP